MLQNLRVEAKERLIGDKRFLRATMKIELAYKEGTEIITRRFPTTTEIEDFHHSPHKLMVKREQTLKNEVLVLMYYRRHGNSFAKLYSGGNYDFNNENPQGIDIEIHMKQPDPDLRIDLGDIAREVCKIHLKPAYILPSRYYISCKIDKCELPDEKAQIFCIDFLKQLQIKVDAYNITKQEKILTAQPPDEEEQGQKEEAMAEPVDTIPGNFPQKSSPTKKGLFRRLINKITNFFKL